MVIEECAEPQGVTVRFSVDLLGLLDRGASSPVEHVAVALAEGILAGSAAGIPLYVSAHRVLVLDADTAFYALPLH